MFPGPCASASGASGRLGAGGSGSPSSWLLPGLVLAQARRASDPAGRGGG